MCDGAKSKGRVRTFSTNMTHLKAEQRMEGRSAKSLIVRERRWMVPALLESVWETRSPQGTSEAAGSCLMQRQLEPSSLLHGICDSPACVRGATTATPFIRCFGIRLCWMLQGNQAQKYYRYHHYYHYYYQYSPAADGSCTAKPSRAALVALPSTHPNSPSL